MEPIALGSKKDWTPVAPRPLQELSFVQARNLEDTTNSDGRMSASASLNAFHESSAMSNKDVVQTEEHTAHSDLKPKPTQYVSSDTASPEEGEVTQEFTVKVDRPSESNQTTDPDVTVKGTPSMLEDKLVNPIQVLVGARPMPAATTGPLNREQTDATNKISQLSWLEDSSERVIEAPVEFHVTATHGALNKEKNTKSSNSVSSHSKTRSNTGKIERARRIKSSVIPEQMQFVIFMTLSSVITVLLLKIAEKML